MHSVVVEIENESGRVRRTLGGAFPAFAQPSADEIEVAGVAYTVEVERHNGYEAIPWSQVPESVVSALSSSAASRSRTWWSHSRSKSTSPRETWTRRTATWGAVSSSVST